MGQNAHDNCFTLLRVMAAVAVLFAHSYNLTGAADPTEFLTGLSLGNLAVHCFFTLSGFLIARSLYKGATLVYFARARILRIYPGLLVCLVFVTLGAAGLTTAPWREFIPAAAHFFFETGSLLFPIRGLPGVFESNFFPNAVNGSLWTLPLEVQCYALAALMSATGVLHPRRAPFLLTALLIALAGMVAFDATLAQIVPGLWRAAPLLPYLFSFAVGMLMACMAAPRPSACALCVAVVAGMAGASLPFGGAKTVLLSIAIAIFSMAFAFCRSPRLLRLSRKMPDYSYGIYIYAFPIQQTLFHIWPDMNPLSNFVLSTALVVPIAAASWRFVESPALALKGRAPDPKLEPARSSRNG